MDQGVDKVISEQRQHNQCALRLLDAESEEMVRKTKTGQVAKLVSSMSGCLYAVTLVVMSFAFEVAAKTLSDVKYNFVAFYLILELSAIIIILYYLVLAHNRKIASFLGIEPFEHSATHDAPKAGSTFLRVGSVVFGSISIIGILLALAGVTVEEKEEAEIEEKHPAATRTAQRASSVIIIVFIVLQTAFSVTSHKVSIHQYPSLAKLALMHLVATNLCVWIQAVVLEEHEAYEEMIAMQEYDRHALANATTPVPELRFEAGHFQPLFTTCLVEYSIIHAGVMFILWLNVGYHQESDKNRRKLLSQRDTPSAHCQSTGYGIIASIPFVVIVVVSLVFFLLTAHRPDNIALNIYFGCGIGFNVLLLLVAAAAAWQFRRLTFHPIKHPREILFDDILLCAGLFGQIMFSAFNLVGVKELNWISNLQICFCVLRAGQTCAQTLLVVVGQRLHSPQQKTSKPGRQLVTFLTISNLALWLFSSLVTLKATSHTDLKQFFSDPLWYVIVHSTVPLTVFYRFHSSACLAEVWKNTYGNVPE